MNPRPLERDTAPSSAESPSLEPVKTLCTCAGARLAPEQVLKILRRILRLANAPGGTEEIAKTAVLALGEQVSQLRVGYATIAPDDMLSVVYSVQPEDMPDLSGLQADVSTAPDYLRSLRSCGPVIVADTERDPRTAALAEAMAAGKTHACLDIPLLYDEQLIGILFLDSPRPHVWSSEEVETMQDIADQVEIALVGALVNEERCRALDTVRANEERLRQIADNLGGVPWMTSLDKSEFLYVGKAVEEIWGFSAEDLERNPLHWLKAVHPDDIAHVRRTLPRQLSGEYDETYRILHPDGSLRWVRDRAFPVKDSAGRPYRIVGVSMDVTRQREAEEQLRATEHHLAERRKMEALGTLAGGVAHDFNNLLSAIMGFTELSLMSVERNSRPWQQMREVMKASERARKLIEQIQTFGKQGPDETEPVQLGGLVEEVVDLVEPVWPAELAIETWIDDTVHVRANPSQVHQVLMNLVTNARLAVGEQPGVVKISIRILDVRKLEASRTGLPRGRYACLAVEDTGDGIPIDIQSKIFDPFFSGREKNRGSGMGLSVVKGVVEAYSGAVTVESIEGVGSTFRVYLPYCHAPGEEVRSPGIAGDRPFASPSDVDAKRILFVDDENYQVNLAERVLTRLGHSTHALTNPHQALADFRADPWAFDCVISDLRMPEMNGLDLCRTVRAQRSDLPIIICTGLDELDPCDVEDLQPLTVVHKPISIGDLGELLAGMLTAKDRRVAPAQIP